MRIKRIEHVAIAVTNLDKARAIFEGTLGFDLGYVETLEHGNTRLAMYPVGDTQIELLEGLAPDTLTAQWIASRGPGLFHICLEVDDLDGAIQECTAKGLTFIQDKPIPGHAGSRIIFVDPKCTGDVLIEFVQQAT